MSIHEMDKSSDHEKEQVQRLEKTAVDTPANAINPDLLDETVQPKLHLKTWLVLAACGMIWFGVNTGVSGTGFWLSSVVADIGGANQQLWFAEGFLILQVAIQPVTGLISDFSGTVRKWLAVTLCSLSAIGLFVAASADSINPQGIAGVCIFGCGLTAYASTSAIVSDVFPRRYRGIVQGVLYASVSSGGIIATLGGGGFIERDGPSGWRNMVYIAGGLVIFGALLLTVCYQPIPVPILEGNLTFLEHLKQVDFIGCILFAGFSINLLMAIIWGGNQYPWDSAHCIATFVVSGVCLFALIGHQLFIKTDGVFNRRLFKNRNFAIMLWAIFTEGVVYITLNIFLAVQISNLYGPSPVLLGLHFAIILIVSSIASLAWGYYSHYMREIRFPLVLSYLIFVGCFVGLAELQPNGQGEAAAYGLCVLTGFAFGGPQGLVITAAQWAVDPDLVGLATAHIIGLRSLGGAVGSTIAGAILTPKLTEYLPRDVAAAAIGAGVDPSQVTAVVGAVLGDTTGAPINIPGVTPAQIGAALQGVRQGFADALFYTFISCVPWSVVAAILLCFMRSVKKELTWHIDRPVEKIEDLQTERA